MTVDAPNRDTSSAAALLSDLKHRGVTHDFDNRQYPYMLRRLGELHEARGNTQQAVDYYSRFVDLWEDADTELQPIVEDIRGRLARLVGER